MRRILLSASVSTVLIFSTAQADGSIEIHEGCVATGCFAGDAPGYPVEITAPGRYRLTSNLYVPFVAQDFSAIRVDASDVSLDLGGFAIISDTTCPLFPPDCSPISFGVGIRVDTSQTTISISNGTVRGFGVSGIDMSEGQVESLLLENLSVRENGFDGIAVRGTGRVVSVTSAVNGAFGVLLDGNFEIRDSYLEGNGGFGVVGGICRDSSFEENNDSTIAVQQQCDRLVGDNLCGTSSC